MLRTANMQIHEILGLHMLKPASEDSCLENT